MKNEEYEITVDEYTFNVTVRPNKKEEIMQLEITCPSNLKIFKNKYLWDIKNQIFPLKSMKENHIYVMQESKINFNNGLEELGMYAIDESNIQTLILPPSMKILRDYSISRCHQLKEIILNDGLEIIGQRAFYYAPITTITLPSTIKYLAPNCFDKCRELQTIIIPENIIEQFNGKTQYLLEHLGCENSRITITKPKTKTLRNSNK